MGGAFRFVTLLCTPRPPILCRPTSIVFHRLLIRRISTTTTTTTTTTRHLSLSSPPTSCHRPHTQLPNLHSIRKELHDQAFSADWEINSPQKLSPITHAWPEWSRLLDSLLSSQRNQSPGTRGTQGNGISPEDAFVAYEEKELSDEFIYYASVCLAFSRSRPELLSFLSRKDIEVIASNGTPFLFKSALDIARRLRAYSGLEGGEGQVLENNRATLVDIMKYIISYASNPSASLEQNGLYSRELVESSVRNLLHQIAEASFGEPVQKLPSSELNQFNGEYEQTPRPLRQNVEMKRGDWICPKCCFMNFARNFKCLECEEPRPKKQLTGREWQCPQCNFYNYGMNLVCLRCDCKRAGAALATNHRSVSELGSDDADLSGGAVAEHFPQVPPLSDGENRLLVGARNTPSKRRHVDGQSKKSMAERGLGGSISESSDPNKGEGSSVKQSLEQILGHSSPACRTGDPTMQINDQTDTSTSFPRFSPSESPQLQDINPCPVPLSRDKFYAQDHLSKTNAGGNLESDSFDMTSRTSPQSVSVSEKASQNVDLGKSESDSQNKDNNQTEKSEKWFQRVAELHNVKDLPSVISDEEFPEIMPMRKGENQFVVSKKKDRSLTSPAYKRHAATGQASNLNFVPFVPFPPGHFARKDAQVSVDKNSPIKSSSETSPSSMLTKNFPKKLDDGRPRVTENIDMQQTKHQVRSSGDLSSNFSGNQGSNLGGNTSRSSFSSGTKRTELGPTELSREENTSQSMNSTRDNVQLPNQDAGSGWTGKSLEGSAVKEPNDLDMSEEAKAERWFRRVAQIKDISELSQIPDEDFPSIMPMRKGVNRFVVSKRKTPLERRLTSQHRRNLPTVSSDPMKKHNETK